MELDKLIMTRSAPAMAPVAPPPDIRNREKWPSWVTTTANSKTSFRTVFVNLITMFDWRISSHVCDVNGNPFFEDFSGYITRLTQTTMPNVQVNRFVFDSRKVGMDYGKLLQVVKDSGRVIFYLGHAQPLHKLLIAAAELNMTQGDYVFLAFIPFRHASFGNFGWAVPGKDLQARQMIKK
ncbi:hypothetical protein BV898_18873 [Hypsibius exemplaris]|uniref:Receptor ligand binding region domain-containing protein n=1 Tax=Hypsibius exemplaris TaxID=2072580 RepID=A0A9X6RP90_HYPEX|nr:hypothetical protein BV898_18873 [Hypsibius exemplaris]